MANYGMYLGVVEDNKDPKKWDRLKIRVAKIHGKSADVPWAYPALPFGMSPPYPVGTSVWVMFQEGDPKYPVYMGYLVNHKEEK